MLHRTLLFLALLTTCSLAAHAQIAKSPTDAMSADNGSSSRSSTNIGSPEQEMLARSEIKAAEKERQENLERAREAAQLGTELRDAYTSSKTFSRLEIKKLERLEKLARRIRSEAGGSDDDGMLDNIPSQMVSAVDRLAETSEAMRKGVEKTPRQVVSASVIERANEVLKIIQYIRDQIR
jgi:vacuolar-type H+-ATPase subunit I/STV1